MPRWLGSRAKTRTRRRRGSTRTRTRRRWRPRARWTTSAGLKIWLRPPQRPRRRRGPCGRVSAASATAYPPRCARRWSTRTRATKSRSVLMYPTSRPASSDSWRAATPFQSRVPSRASTVSATPVTRTRSFFASTKSARRNVRVVAPKITPSGRRPRPAPVKRAATTTTPTRSARRSTARRARARPRSSSFSPTAPVCVSTRRARIITKTSTASRASPSPRVSPT
mmetsp:Transcript_19176/g.59039  ORF Transcript_19176/g.59039 Transcript_19176/m.59039 type:complete len:225 (-) Transcript_19176:690-1364(-)